MKLFDYVTDLVKEKQIFILDGIRWEAPLGTIPYKYDRETKRNYVDSDDVKKFALQVD